MSLPRRNIALIVLGMHRSGTSALTGVLAMAGADPGPSLIPGVADVNPKGFWEHEEIVAIHERLLTALGSSWDDCRPLPGNWWERSDMADFRRELVAVVQRDFSGSPLWVMKDPRQCRLLPLWLDIFREIDVAPHFVLCLRPPQEVADSLKARDGIPEEMAGLAWLMHLIESERWTRNTPRVTVTYAQLLADWREVVKRIAQDLSSHLQPGPEAAARIDAFLEPALRHHVASAGVPPDSPLLELATSAYDAATHSTCDRLASTIEPFAAAIEPYVRQVRPWESYLHLLRIKYQQKCQQIPLLQAEIARLECTNHNLGQEIERVKNTVSWRITSPLRVIWNVLRRS